MLPAPALGHVTAVIDSPERFRRSPASEDGYGSVRPRDGGSGGGLTGDGVCSWIPLRVGALPFDRPRHLWDLNGFTG